jgi:general secretion pathway protein D
MNNALRITAGLVAAILFGADATRAEPKPVPAEENSVPAARGPEPEGAAKDFRRDEVEAKGAITGADFTAGREVGWAPRERTRADLIGEVDRSWQRPGNYEDGARVTAAPLRDTALAEKLDRIILPSVSFTKVELGQIVRTLSAASEEFDADSTGPKGVNIVLVDPEHQPPAISITLHYLTLRRVLDLVADAAGYQYEVLADAVVLRPGDETPPLVTEYFPLSRSTVLRTTGIGATAGDRTEKREAGSASEASSRGSEAAALKTFLQQAGVNFEATPGSSLAYDGSGVFATHTARNLDQIRQVLGHYTEVRQVQIEAKFMEVQDGALDELGVTWNLTRRGLPQLNPETGLPVLDGNGRQVLTPRETYDTSGTNRSLSQAFSGAQSASAIIIDGQPVAGTQAPRLPGSVSLGDNATALANISGMVGEFDVNAVIRALAQKQGTDLLSAPRVTVLSGHTATITVAQEMRYPQSYGEIQSQVGSTAGGGSGGSGSAGVTITAGTPQEFATRNVGVELKCTPTVEEDDCSISLDLNPKVTEFEGFVEYGGPSLAISAGTSVTVPPGFYQPIFSVREVSTKVTIWNGATLIMGGLTREEVKKVEDKVPVLGSIPLLGRLFRSKGQSSQKRNLLIFVTATLVDPGGAPKKQTMGNVPSDVLHGAETRVRGR